MTDEELKNKCKERAKIFQQAMESYHSNNPIDCIEWFADRITELEAQVEKMKCCGNCKYRYFIGDELECHLLDKGINCDDEEKWEIKEK